MRRRFLLNVWLFILLAFLASASVAAGTSVGSFEIDGNRADDSGSGDQILDWDSPPPGVTTFADASGTSDNSFGQGSKELEPGGWSCVAGGVPGKDDIVAGDVAFRTLAGKHYLFVDFQRATTNGDAHIDYEFNQSKEPNPACPSLPKRTAGDVVVAFDTENGGRTINVRAFRWQGDAATGTFVELQLGSQGSVWDGAVNIPNTIPGLEAGAFGEASLNLSDTIGDISCALFSTVFMKSRASTSITSEIKDRTDALPVNFAVDRPDLANGSGSAFGARIKETLLGIDQTLVPVSSSQSGVGSNHAGQQLLDVDVPSDGSILRADVVRSSATSTVTAAPAEALHNSTAETANVNVLNGLVTAGAVRGVATARANGHSSSISSLGSAFKDLAVQGVAVNDVTPNTRIDLPADLFGPGSYVLLYERIGSTSRPAAGQTSEGTYAADLTVNMIHVFITDKLPLVAGNQSVEVIVSQAVAHADFPQTTVCPGAPDQSVSGHAFVGSETTDSAQLPILVGFVSIPSTGGRDHQDLDQATLSSLNAGAAVSESTGTLGTTESAASSFAQVSGVCALPGPSGCAVAATLVRAQSNSTANGSGASGNDTGTTLVGASVLGTPVSAAPPPNTVVELPGIGFVILNEQFCDNGASLTAGCADGTGHAGLTVRAIRVVVTVPDNPRGVKTGEVIVAEAHSDATYR
jgi:hypothetical protein